MTGERKKEGVEVGSHTLEGSGSFQLQIFRLRINSGSKSKKLNCKMGFFDFVASANNGFCYKRCSRDYR